jgi:hypothetical protein
MDKTCTILHEGRTRSHQGIKDPSFPPFLGKKFVIQPPHQHRSGKKLENMSFFSKISKISKDLDGLLSKEGDQPVKDKKDEVAAGDAQRGITPF